MFTVVKWLQKYGQSYSEFYMQTVGVSHIQPERQERFYFSWRTPVSDPLGGGWQAGGGEGGVQGAFFCQF